MFFSFFVQFCVKRHRVVQRFCHCRGGFERTEVETSAHSVGSPEFYVVGIVVRFLQDAPVFGVPGFYAVVKTFFRFLPQLFEPFRIAADAPVPVNLHDAAQLSVGRRVSLVVGRAYRKPGAEVLVAVFILHFVEFGLSQRTFQSGKKMGGCLRVIPHVGA